MMNNLEERAAAVQKIIDNYSWQSEPTIKSMKDYFPDNIPEGDFKWDADEAGDWHAIRCHEKDCEAQWHMIAYAVNLGRESGKLYLEYMDCDQDGDWNIVYYWDEEFSKEEEKEVLIALGAEINDYFASWARYDLYCYETGEDPLEQVLVGRFKRETFTKEEWIKSAEDNAKRLDDRLNK